MRGGLGKKIMVIFDDPITLGYIVVAVALLYYFVLRGIFQVRDDQVGILTKKLGGKKMPQGQVIARHGQIGIQAETLVPGWYYRIPIFWAVKRVPLVEIQPDEVGLVEAIDGQPLPKGRLLGDEVDCNQFQDAEKFLDTGGYKGPQVGVLRPGRYRINTSAFNLTKDKAIRIESGQVGLITAQDGKPLPPKLIIAPEPPSPIEGDEATRKYKSHNFFQDGQAFLDTVGYRGPQLATLQPGRYYINTLLFDVKIGPVAEVQPGFVAVLRSNVGEELARTQTRPTLPSSQPELDDKITHDVETLLITDKNMRGILEAPIAPGKYNLNTYAYSAYLVPTSAIMVDWASTDRPATPSITKPPVLPGKDDSSGLYPTDQTFRGVSFFQFNQLKVTSIDGFQLEVDVRMVIRILPENAAFIIARFGTVFNLIQQIVHPLIDASFRNNAGEKNALDFIQGRTALQKEALERAKVEFEKYHVEAQNLLISYIAAPLELLATQTLKQIALQQQTQYQEQAKAEEQRIAVQAKTAIANKQPDVITAQLQIQINENNAVAQVRQAEGIRDSTKIKADGDAFQIRRTGEAQAAAYHAQADVLGSDRVALVRVMEEIRDGKIKVVPDVLVTSGQSKEGAGGNLFAAYLATLLSQSGSKPTQSYASSEQKDYSSELTKEQPKSTSAPMTMRAQSAQLDQSETPVAEEEEDAPH